MATSPARAGVVRPVTDHGIAEGIEYERDQESRASQRRLQAHHGAVEKQQEIGKAIVLDSIRHGSKAVGEADTQADRFASRVFAGCCVCDLDNLMTCSEMPALCINPQPNGELGHDNCLTRASTAHGLGGTDTCPPPRQTLAARSRVWYKHRTISQIQPQADAVAAGWYGC